MYLSSNLPIFTKKNSDDKFLLIISPLVWIVPDVKDQILCAEHFAHFMARNVKLQQDSLADVSLYKIQ